MNSPSPGISIRRLGSASARIAAVALALACASTGAQAEFVYRAAVPSLRISEATVPLGLTPASRDFGGQLLMSETRQTFTVSNSNDKAVNFVSGPALTGSNAFSVTSNTCAASVPAKSQCDVQVAFRPTVSGPAQASLTFETQTGQTAVPLSGSGAGDLSLHLKFDGVTGSTIIVDEAGSTVTNYEGVAIQDGSFVSGNGAGQFGGYRRLTVNAPSKFNFNSTPFTAEVWFKPTSATGLQGLFGNFQLSARTGWRLITNNAAGYTLLQSDIGSLVDTSSPGGIILANKWNHAALVGTGTSVTLYANGVAQFTTAQQPGLNSTGLFYVGINPDQSSGLTWRFQGQMDEVKVVKGVALYSGNFTPLAPAKP